MGKWWRGGGSWTRSHIPLWGEVAEGRHFPRGPSPHLAGVQPLGGWGVLGTSEKNVQPQPQACPPKLSSLFAAAHPSSHSF